MHLFLPNFLSKSSLIKMKMNSNPGTKNEEIGSPTHSNPLSMREIEHSLFLEKQKNQLLKTELELSNLAARQEINKLKREIELLQDNVSRLEEDRNVLKLREAKDQERAKQYLEKIEKNEKEFAEKLIELKMENWDLNLALHAYTKKCESLVEENSRLKGKENVDSDKEETILIRQIKKRKHEDMGNNVANSSLNSSIRQSGLGNTEANETPVGFKDLHIPRTPAKNDNMKSIGSCSQQKKSKEFDFASPQTGRKSGRVRCGVVVNGVQTYYKRGSCSEYTGRIASSKQLESALKRANTLQKNLRDCNLSFIKPMVRSHVSSGFWLSLPLKFSEENLSHINGQLITILEDVDGLEYETNCFHDTRRCGLSGGWRGFAVDHKLEIGDVLVFELCEPARFKVYIVKAIPDRKKASGQKRT